MINTIYWKYGLRTTTEVFDCSIDELLSSNIFDALFANKPDIFSCSPEFLSSATDWKRPLC